MSMKTNDTITILTHLGKVQGSLKNNVVTFYGVPYAADPFVKTKRFQAPEPIKPWQGVLRAIEMKPPVPQPGRGKNVKLVGAPGDLTVNIWAPEDAFSDNNQRPVMVWLPGGAYIRADAGEGVYDGSHFAQKGVVIVTVNYRVGVDGFMHIDGAPDNRGTLDQILALKWVKNNIEDYGGDPSNITLFGQSAGASSVAILLGSSRANTLFDKAIMQSPPMQAISKAQAAEVTRAFAKKLSIEPTLAALSNVPFEALVKGVVDIGNAIKSRREWGMLSWGGTAFLPVVDGELIINSPMLSLKNGANPSIPTIVGSTDQESRLYLVPSNEIETIDESKVSLFLHDLNLGEDARKVYKKTGHDSYGDIYADIQSDYTFRMPAIQIAELLTESGSTVWKYNFGWKSGAYDGELGAAHFVDVPYTFDTIDTEEASNFVGDKPSENLSQTMQNYWVRFAKVGEPGWSEYTKGSRKTMRFDNQSVAEEDPNKLKRALWKAFEF
ncbi:carboxylesterase family protein [Alteromonas sp. ALT199]|uniref:carboxylesterase/lipase family protein n=1 Tax=unclassified Alteromonas TaxID=2614992 RepID=UPI001BEBCC05|nr:carboxylesterase family protein [Alteromonas sp. ALT199]MBT3134708.1 carboxylesterase family protein [Alteromonas sp. ALT199]